MSSLVWNWAGCSSLGSEPTVPFSGPRRPPPLRPPRRPRRNLLLYEQARNRTITVIGLPRCFEPSVCSKRDHGSDEPNLLTSCMPYTDLRPHDRPIQL